MRRHYRRIGFLFLWIEAVVLGGCAPVPPRADKVFPQGGPTAEQIYKDQLSRGAADDALAAARRSAGYGEENLAGYTRDAVNELDVEFPRLPNPTLVMYIRPHITQDGVPIPGYATRFTLYTTTEYALPGEVPVQDNEER